MNSGLWISFPLSAGSGWRWTVPLAVAVQTPPLRDFGGGGLMSHLNSYRIPPP